MGSIVLTSALLVFVYMVFWFTYAQIKTRNDIADVAWGPGFMLIAYGLAFRFGEFDLKTTILLILVSLWGLRLAIHIGSRHRNKSEDGRYVAMREKWKHPFIQSFLEVFMTQGFFMLLVATPIMLFYLDDSPTLAWFNLIGIAIWAIGFVFESVSDKQLADFIKNPNKKTKVMKSGLWSYTRHPNYFGEISQWWGFYIFTLFTPFWYLGIIGPITITYLIIGISGIPMLEKRYKGDKEYEEYKKTTSAFFPLPKKS